MLASTHETLARKTPPPLPVVAVHVDPLKMSIVPFWPEAMQNDVLRQVTLLSMLVVPLVTFVHVTRSVVVTMEPPRPTAVHVVVPGRHETECR